MLHQSHLAPAHALPIPNEIRGTRRAIFFLLRRIIAQPGQPTALSAQTFRDHPTPVMDADHFVFQF